MHILHGNADSPPTLQELGALQAVLSSLGAGLVDAHKQHFLDVAELNKNLKNTSDAFQRLIGSLRLEIARATEKAASRSSTLVEEMGIALQQAGSEVKNTQSYYFYLGSHQFRTARHCAGGDLFKLSQRPHRRGRQPTGSYGWATRGACA